MAFGDNALREASALNLNVHVHMLILDGVYIEHPDGSLRFHWLRAPTSAELAALTQTLDAIRAQSATGSRRVIEEHMYGEQEKAH